MKPFLFRFPIVLLFIAVGCAHQTPRGLILELPASEFTQSTQIQHLVIIPSDLPTVKIPILRAGRYHARLWSEERSGRRLCIADTGILRIETPQDLVIASAYASPIGRRNYVIEVNYTSSGGQSSGLSQQVASWW